MSGTKKFIGLFGWLALCTITMAVGGALGYLRLDPTIDSWFNDLVKPRWTPPIDFFLPVWLGLFALMAVAAWVVWLQREEPIARLGCKFFVAQLLLILVWIVVFLGAKNPGAGAIEVVVLWLAIFATLCLFWQRSKLAGLLMFPQLAGATFAAYLNIMIWQMNT